MFKSSFSSDELTIFTYFNQHCFNIYLKNSEYKKILDNDALVYIDGIGMNILCRMTGQNVNRIYNTSDLYDELFQYLSLKNTGVFILGGNFDKIEIFSLAEQKKLNLLDYHTGFFPEENIGQVADRINKSGAEILVIGMGVPLQEKYSIMLKEKINCKIILCVGNYLEFYTGKISRIPKPFRNLGVEWIYRMITEPARLWKRYIFGIPLFILNSLKLIYSMKFLKNKI